MKTRKNNPIKKNDKSPFDKALIRLGQHLVPQQPSEHAIGALSNKDVSQIS